MENTLTLILNSAEKRIQFVLSQDQTLLCAQDWLIPRGGAELLTPALKDALRRLGASAADIGQVAAVAGPGTFTGLRLALATAAGLARAVGAKQAGLDYLQALAASVRARPGARLRVLVNARPGWVYHADYVAGENGVPRRTEDIVLLPLSEEGKKSGAPLRLSHKSRPMPDFLLGSGLTSNREQLRELYPADVTLLDAGFDHPTPAGLLLITREVAWSGNDIAPRYLRDCDAVDNLDNMARDRGEDPVMARERLARLMERQL